MIRDIIREMLSSDQRLQIKRHLRKTKNKLQFWVKPVSLEYMRSILVKDLGIKKGDKIFVTSSFGGLNATFTPKDLVLLLMDIVSPEGMIMMPYYPPGSSVEWARSKNEFDMKSTVSSTGIVTNVFSKMPNVVKSLHPTKSVCAWGGNCKKIIDGHLNSLTPFSEGSPYYNLLMISDSKSIGLGTLKFPMGHCIEDVISGIGNQYEKNKADLIVRSGTETYNCSTYIHNEHRNQIPPSIFVKDAPTYRKVKIGHSYGFSVQNSAAFTYYKEQFAMGHKSIW